MPDARKPAPRKAAAAATKTVAYAVQAESVSKLKVDGLVVVAFQPDEAQGKSKTKKSDAKTLLPLTGQLAELDKTLGGYLAELIDEESYSAAKGSLLTIRRPAGSKLPAKRVIVVGLGKQKDYTVARLENALLKAITPFSKWENITSVAIALPAPTPCITETELCVAAVDAVTQANYRSDEVTEANALKGALKHVVLVPDGKTARPYEAALPQAQAFAEARSFAKKLTDKPANIKSTQTLVDAAKGLAKAYPSLSVTVQDSPRWIEKEMPCFFEVAKGSVASDPPKFIALHYTPPGSKTKKGGKTLTLVGKSVIFDTGGYQVKPGDYMVTMKGDMTGGATVLATMKMLAELKPNIKVSAFLAATPNRIDANAMVPDSIVNTTVGKKVEIRHTDAEGRLTLIDAVAKALTLTKDTHGSDPAAIVTVATLTGSASVAVGRTIALLTRYQDRAWRDRFYLAAATHGDPIQSLELFEEDFENIKSKLDGADIRNTSQAERMRGAQTAAAFVMNGASDEDLPFIHLDIAGADFTADEKATGIGVKALCQFVLNEASLETCGRLASAGRPVYL